jgi:hypothetical protein
MEVQVQEAFAKSEGEDPPSIVIHGSGCKQAAEVPQEQSHTAFAGEESSELHKLFARVHRLMGELAKAKGDQTSSVLQEVTQALSRQEALQPLRGFLQRLLALQRSKLKENMPPHGKAATGIRDPMGEFVENDYASIRELAHRESLTGSFPHALLAHLKRILAGPTAASTRRAGLDCLRALVSACGPLLLRTVVQQFVSSGILLHAAATRGPAQAHARAILSELVSLRHRTSLSSPLQNTPGHEEPDKTHLGASLRNLRIVWRALMQNSPHRGIGTSTATVGVISDPGQLAELLRWLSDDVLGACGSTVTASDSREILMVVAPALRDRSTSVRAMAARAVHALMQARGGESYFREDVHMVHLSRGIKEDTLSCLDAGPPHSGPTFGAGLSRTPSTLARSPSVPASTHGREPMSPGDANFRLGVKRTSNSQPRRLRFSPQVDRTPVDRTPAKSPDADMIKAATIVGDSLGECSTRLSGMSSVSRGDSSASSIIAPVSALTYAPIAAPDVGSPQALERELTAWSKELVGNSCIDWNVWHERAASLPGHLEKACLRHTGPESAPLVPATLLLCRHLVSRGALSKPIEPALLDSALTLAHAAKICFGAQVVQYLNSAAAVASFRSALQALTQLQQLSKSGIPIAQRAAAPLLMELPPILAGIIDHLDASVQLVAWIRVAAEVVEEEIVDVGGPGTSQGWALRFCARCVDRLAVQLPPGGADFPAWEVLSEVMRFHERHHASATESDDHAIWRRALEGAARAVSRQFPDQAREFLRLANCTGSPIPKALEGMLVVA